MKFALKLAAVGFVLAVAFAFTLERPPIDTVQRGYRGLGLIQVYNDRKINSPIVQALNAVPEPQEKADLSGTPSSQAYENVQVLKNVDSAEFLRLMAAITQWVSPDQGCAYCHAEGASLADDSLYTKRVARRMLQMTQYINTEKWKTHVANTGVTCYTCHRGYPVPQNIWFAPAKPAASGMLTSGGLPKNKPGTLVGLASLPNDPFTPFLEDSQNIRVNSTTALPSGNRQSIKQAEWTYGLMMHMSTSLGVNCTYCHNSRAFSAWDQSPPQRATAWYGIRLVRDLNVNYLNPLQTEWPAARLGPAGDGPKLNCTTCHQGAYKPLYGASMLQDYEELRGTAAPSAALEPASAPVAAVQTAERTQ